MTTGWCLELCVTELDDSALGEGLGGSSGDGECSPFFGRLPFLSMLTLYD